MTRMALTLGCLLLCVAVVADAPEWHPDGGPAVLIARAGVVTDILPPGTSMAGVKAGVDVYDAPAAVAADKGKPVPASAVKREPETKETLLIQALAVLVDDKLSAAERKAQVAALVERIKKAKKQEVAP